MTADSLLRLTTILPTRSDATATDVAVAPPEPTDKIRAPSRVPTPATMLHELVDAARRGRRAGAFDTLGLAVPHTAPGLGSGNGARFSARPSFRYSTAATSEVAKHWQGA